MSFQDFVNRLVRESSLSQSDFNAMVAAAGSLYSNSATARTVMDKLAAEGKFLLFGFVQDSANATDTDFTAGGFDFTGAVSMDLSWTSGLSYIDQNGRAAAVSTERVLMHEMVHALEGLSDNTPLNDPLAAGDTVDLTNTIMNEMGFAQDRLSYLGLDSSNEVVIGQDYSFGEQIDGAFIGNSTVTFSDFVVSKEVLIGVGNHDNNFDAGGGRDFLYGQGGDDNLIGGAGNDYINGGAGHDIAIYSSSQGDFTLTTLGNGNLQVSTSSEGIDELTGIERISTADGDYISNLAGTDADNELVYLVYDASLGRTPDEAGFVFWTDVMSNGVADVDNPSTLYDNERAIWLTEFFVSSAEFVSNADTDGSGTLSAFEVVTEVYESALRRAPDTEGFNFWLTVYDQYEQEETTFGATAEARLFANFAESPENVLRNENNYEDGFFYVA